MMKRQGDGAGIRYEYDTEDHRIRVHYPDGDTERIRYDTNGNLIKRVSPEQYDSETDDGNLTVNEWKTGNIYSFNGADGEFFSKPKGGVTWGSGKIN